MTNRRLLAAILCLPLAACAGESDSLLEGEEVGTTEDALGAAILGRYEQIVHDRRRTILQSLTLRNDGEERTFDASVWHGCTSDPSPECVTSRETGTWRATRNPDGTMHLRLRLRFFVSPTFLDYDYKRGAAGEPSGLRLRVTEGPAAGEWFGMRDTRP